MKLLLIVTLLLFNLCCFSQSKVGVVIPDFTLKNVNGKMLSTSQYRQAKGFIVVFTCNHCPFAKRYEDRLNTFHKKYEALGFPLLAISATDPSVVKEDTFEEMVKRAKQKGYEFPYLFDSSQSVAKAFKANKTPHSFVVLKENGTLITKYSGAIDDNGAEPEKITKHYLTDAVDALIGGKPIAISETKLIGCEIKIRK